MMSAGYDERDIELRMVERAQSGNRHALDQLLKRAYPYVFGYLMKVCQDEGLARDLTQDVMVKAIVKINSFRGESKFSTWLVAMAANLYKDHVRREKSLVPLDLEAVLAEGSTDSRVIKEELRQDLENALKCLPQEQRQAFVLKHMMGYSYEAIAKVLDCPVGTVRSRLHNGIKVLRSVMEKRGWP